jgi:RimJ/RimL family protein N-acetyltransferase
MNELLSGKLIRLAAFDPEEMGKAFSTWSRDSEYWRLMDAGVVRMPSVKDAVKHFEKELEEPETGIYFFSARRLTDDKLIGEMVLEVFNWTGRDAFVGLSIGERENWGQGYGTEMMRLLLQFAFMEVNLRRVTLTVFEYNPRAIRSYEKSGFRHEGGIRQFLNKEGRRWDMLFMGILREEWLQLGSGAPGAVLGAG